MVISIKVIDEIVTDITYLSTLKSSRQKRGLIASPFRTPSRGKQLRSARRGLTTNSLRHYGLGLGAGVNLGVAVGVGVPQGCSW